MAKGTTYFTDDTLAFLRDLSDHNDRDWFNANKDRYDAHVKEPALRFIMDFEPHLQRISSHFLADPRPVGGSLFRLHRDVRFSKDKSPYKTHTGIRFPHARNKDVHAPGFYLHLEPDEVFTGGGLWHPDPPTTAVVRDAMVANAREWQSVKSKLPSGFRIEGDRLSRPPRGYDADHPLIDDLRLKDFTVFTQLDEADACAPGFLDRFVEICRASAPFMRFLTEAVGQPWK